MNASEITLARACLLPLATVIINSHSKSVKPVRGILRAWYLLPRCAWYSRNSMHAHVHVARDTVPNVQKHKHMSPPPTRSLDCARLVGAPNPVGPFWLLDSQVTWENLLAPNRYQSFKACFGLWPGASRFGKQTSYEV